MADATKTGLVFIERFADWEYGFLAASLVEWFGGSVIALTPGGATVHSASGLALPGVRPLDPDANDDLGAIAVIGSDQWPTAAAPEIGGLLESIAARGGVVGGICAGTLPLARAGLFDGRRHTSNGRVWIADHLDSYPGQGFYQDVPHAVADGNVVSAPGSAPATFAARFIEALHPDRRETVEQMLRIFSGEHAAR